MAEYRVKIKTGQDCERGNKKNGTIDGTKILPSYHRMYHR